MFIKAEKLITTKEWRSYDCTHSSCLKQQACPHFQVAILLTKSLVIKSTCLSVVDVTTIPKYVLASFTNVGNLYRSIVIDQFSGEKSQEDWYCLKYSSISSLNWSDSSM